MSKYILRLNNTTYQIAKVQTESFYTFSPKGSKYSEVKSITIYDLEKIRKIIIRKLMIRYQRLLTDLTLLFEGEESADGYMQMLGEVAKFKDILELKYKKFLQRELYEQFLEDLMNISKVLQQKLDERNVSKGR